MHQNAYDVLAQLEGGNERDQKKGHETESQACRVAGEGRERGEGEKAMGQ